MSKAARGRRPETLLRLPQALGASALSTFPISSGAIRFAATLDRTHGDPWDRVLLAQATLADLALVPKDAVLDAVSDRRVW